MRNPTRTTLDHLGDVIAFMRVADARSFTVAAERLGMSRSAVGKCIARLEETLAARLVHRTTRSVSLSEEGRIFYEHAVRIVSEVEDAEDALAQRTGMPRGRLRIDLPVAFGRMYIMPLLREFLEKWPEIEADVTFSDEYSDLVADGIDVAIRIGGANDSRLIRKVLAPHRLITCASPSYLERRGVPQSPEDLLRHRTVAYTHSHLPVPWRYRVGGADREFGVEGRLRLGCTQAVRDAAVAGLGIAQLGSFLVGEDIKAGRLVRILEEFSRDMPPVCAVYPTRRHLSPKVRVFIDEIKAGWAGHPPWECWSDSRSSSEAETSRPGK